MSEAWHVIRSKPRKEDFLAGQLRNRKLEVFNPQLRVQPVNPRARKMKPYFPGYVFLRVDLEEMSLSALQWMPGAIGLVCFGGEPAPVSDKLIQTIRKRVAAEDGTAEEPLNGFETGERVIVQSGPFSGYEAIFDARASGSERVRVLLQLLSEQQVPLELPAGQIQRKMVGNRQCVQSIS